MYDFNIQNYSVQDLEKLFQLKSKNYTKKEIKEKKQEFYEKITNATTAKHENPKLVKELTEFLDEAYRLLVYFIHDDDNDNKTPHPESTPVPMHESKQRHTPQYDYNVKKDPSQDHMLQYLDAKYKYTSNQSEIYDRTKNEIIPPIQKPFKTVMQNEFNPGIINPIHTPILTKCLNIDTRFRDDIYRTKSTDFIFTLPDRIRKVVSMRLSAYEFPVSNIYNISQSYGNNYLNILCTYTPGSGGPAIKYAKTVIKTVIISDGTYNIEDLIKQINQQLQPRDSSNNLIYPNLDDNGVFNCIQFTLPDQETGKICLEQVQLSSTEFPNQEQIMAIGMDFTLDIKKEKDLTDVKTKMGWNLGFIRPKYYDKTKYYADTQTNMDTIKYIYLMINDFNNSVNNNFFIGAFPKYVLNKNILARIPIQQIQQTQTPAPPTYQIKYQQENQLTQHMEPRRYFGPVDIQRLHIQIYDEFGRILDINNSNYSICLTFQCIYD